jgi:hypothetical protein
MGSDINQTSASWLQNARIPLINMSHIELWQLNHPIVNGTAPRWLFPIVADKNIDSLVMVMNISL